MLPISLFAENVVRTDGVGPSVDIRRASGKLLVVTLEITRIIEQESLEVSVWGSSDNERWDLKPLVSMPQKFYCGVYSTLLNLSGQPQVRYLRVSWKMSRWTRPEGSPLFSFHVNADESGARIHARTEQPESLAAPAIA